jgi:hypothetical protein
VETLHTHEKVPGKGKVLREEIIEIGYHPEDDRERKITEQKKTL